MSASSSSSSMSVKYLLSNSLALRKSSSFLWLLYSRS
jgi:hypothetical protein